MPSVTSCAYDFSLAEASADEHDMGTYTIGYIVQTDGLLGPQSVVQGAFFGSPHPLPTLWSTYSYQGDTDNLSWLREYKVTRDPKSHKLYYITVVYKPAEPGEGSQENTEDPIGAALDPISREAVVWWDREVQTKIKFLDKDGAAILNPAKDYYERDIEHEQPRAVLVVEKNVATLGEVYAYQTEFDNAVNSSSWSIGGETIAARAALCREVSSGPPVTEQGYTFFKVVFRFVFAEEGFNWDEPMKQGGRRWWVKKGDGTYRTTVDSEGSAFRTIYSDNGKFVALNDDGTRKPDDDDYDIKYWRVRREVDFNSLPF